MLYMYIESIVWYGIWFIEVVFVDFEVNEWDVEY